MSNGKKILIAEDDHSILQLLTKELEQRGFSVSTADNGETAWELIQAERPAVVVLDVIMPKMHGVELVRKLRREPWGKKLPVLLLTNFGEDPEVRSLVAEDHCELLVKSETRLQDIILAITNHLSPTV